MNGFNNVFFKLTMIIWSLESGVNQSEKHGRDLNEFWGSQLLLKMGKTAAPNSLMLHQSLCPISRYVPHPKLLALSRIW